ncbi:MAG TPA: dephospho-CoA kinase [Saprospiraceae bacterium]|nr:dephospho-CoA kinase [Saprospiraceae bacterium]
MLEIGITGGIGSGKTTVAKIFELLGIPVYYADDRAKQLMVQNTELVNSIKKLLGADSYTNKGELNRTYIASIIFKDPKKLSQLNTIVHPVVWSDGIQWNDAYEKKGIAYTLKEAALIFESGGDQFLDKVICVYSPIELRINRVMARDHTTRDAVLERIEKQLPDEIKMEKSDFIIYNDGSQSLIEQVLKVHRKIVTLSTIKS